MSENDPVECVGPFLVVRDVDGVRHAIRDTCIAGLREAGAGEDGTLIVTRQGTVSVPSGFGEVLQQLGRMGRHPFRRG
ncbi:hypothetical protein CCC_03165 [Paramagnetospirillum magnetotacticum MS-1]|uniref:Uncharacterized protein n=1 Tax=Paramagnetospirillum magnetotacticum MS-1 TaxID=272627 RepID=A0A0C2UGA5_PARME|nr:hypothetical protein [Paramagnetospirillum magnetotacticum]KIM00563.1 hypothetical protein CCC_03165 [Paramagnetospirillum magnetotacticum MS-1]